MKGVVCRGEWQEQLLQYACRENCSLQWLLCEISQYRQLLCFPFFHLNSEETSRQS